jgi:hypothetical protein
MGLLERVWLGGARDFRAKAEMAKAESRNKMTKAK